MVSHSHPYSFKEAAGQTLDATSFFSHWRSLKSCASLKLLAVPLDHSYVGQFAPCLVLLFRDFFRGGS
jgi:hypothetical protein